MVAQVSDILGMCGLGSYLHIGDAANSLVFELLKNGVDAYGIDKSPELVKKHMHLLGIRYKHGSCLDREVFSDKTFDTIIIGSEILTLGMDTLADNFKALYDLTERFLVVYFPAPAMAMLMQNSLLNRSIWDEAILNSGFRRNVLFNHDEFQKLDNPNVNFCTFFEKVPLPSLEKYSHKFLLEQKSRGFADLMRNNAREFDASLSRYTQIVSSYIHEGDLVIDLASDLGAGLYTLAASSNGNKFIGIETSLEAVDYANANYAALNKDISYKFCYSFTDLSFLPDHSVDFITAFNTLHYVEDISLFVAEIQRVLKPDGRLFGSVAALFGGQNYRNSCYIPRQIHDGFNWQDLLKIFGEEFFVDSGWRQTAGVFENLSTKKREIHKFDPLSVSSNHTEWWIFGIKMRPEKFQHLPYTNPFALGYAADDLPTIVDFGKFYDNPWLYRVIVQQHHRILDGQQLFNYCNTMKDLVRHGSADHGAILCVLSYRLMDRGNITKESVKDLFIVTRTFFSHVDENNPHVYRWMMSIHYIFGKLLLAIGERNLAMKEFLSCAQMDPLKFSALLATKTISARIYSAILSIKQDPQVSKEHLVEAIKVARKVASSDFLKITGNITKPISFGLTEFADLMNMASQCANALLVIDRYQGSPALLWRKINLKFFGLLDWNRHLENENKDLRNDLAKLCALALENVGV
jgi:SAM-dependent methyltransferase